MVAGDEKICPRCAETIKAAAVVCRFCGAEFAAPEPRSHPVRSALPDNAGLETPPKKSGQGVAIGCVSLVFVVLLIGMCAGPAPKTDDPAGDTTAVAAGDSGAADATAAGDATASAWSYSEQKDEVRGKIIYFANATSLNSVDFDFPYGGGSTLRLTVRRHPEWGEDVIVEISSGQFVCGLYDCKGKINYGSGPQSITLNTPEDHDSNTLFIKGARSVIDRLRKSEKVVIELPFYQEGNRQFTFDTKGFVWPPKGASADKQRP